MTKTILFKLICLIAEYAKRKGLPLTIIGSHENGTPYYVGRNNYSHTIGNEIADRVAGLEYIKALDIEDCDKLTEVLNDISEKHQIIREAQRHVDGN